MLTKNVKIFLYDLIVFFVLISLISGLYSSILNNFGFGFLVFIFYIMFFCCTIVFVLSSSYSSYELFFVSIILLLYLFAIISIFYSHSSFIFKKFMNLSVSIYSFFAAKYIIEKVNILLVFRVWFFLSLIMNIIILYVLFLIHFEVWKYPYFQDKMMPNYLISAIYSYPVCIYFIFKGKKLEKFLSLLIIFIQIYLGGRGPIIFLILILLFVHFDFKSKRLFFISKRFLYALMFMSIIIIVGFKFHFFDMIIARFELFLNSNNEFIRFNQYKYAIEAILKKPLLGYGLNSTGIVIPPHLDYNMSYPHNIYLEAWLESGLILFILLLFLTLYFTFKFFEFSINKKDDMRIYILSVIFFYFLNSLKSDSYVDMRMMFFFMGLYVFYENKFFCKSIIPLEHKTELINVSK